MTAIILVNPQLGENIGACARAMLNFGFTDLRIVNPRDGWPNQRAIDTASGALDSMVRPTLYETLAEALQDVNFSLATTARRRDMVKTTYSPTSATEKISTLVSQKCAVVFGAERTGLLNEDLALCSGVINIPTNPDFSSLNLAQAVLLVCSELSKTKNLSLDVNEQELATYEKLHELLTRLESELDKARFFRSEGLREKMVHNIQSIFTRNELTDQEVRTLHGVVSALIGNKSQE